MKAIVTTIEGLTGSVGLLVSLVIIPLVVATCYEVFSRYIFGAPTAWAFELGYILTGTHFLLGAAIALLRESHIRIDLIYARFSPRVKAATDLIFYVCLFLPFLVLLCDSLAEYALRSFETGELSELEKATIETGERTGQSSWNPPIWPFRAIITFSFGLLTLQVVAEILKCIAVLRGQPISKESEG